MAAKFAGHIVMRWRMAALLLAVAVSVILPYVFTRSATNEALAARVWVAHSAQVRATVYKLVYRLRDMEAATYALLQGLDGTELYARIDMAREQVAPLMAELRRLTLDNPDQLGRLGGLKMVVHQRVDAMEDARKRYRAGDVAGAYRALAASAKQYRYRDMAEVIVKAEADLLQQRTAIADHKGQIARYVMTGTTVAQLLLLGIVVVVSERAIAHRLRAERISQQAVARAQRIVQTVREPMAVLDGDLNMVMVNAAFVELYGSGADQDGRQSLAQAGDGAWADSSLQQRLLDVISRDRELWDYSVAQTTVDGVDRYMLVNARRMQLPDGDEPALLLSVSDVTARTLAENRASELNRQLEGKVEQVSEVNRELEAFSYSVSHDLRAPLRHIAGFSEKLGQHLGDDVDAKTGHYLDVIGESARRMAQLIDDLLVYSRFGRGALRLQPVDMQSLADQARALAMADVEGRDIAWRIAPLPVVVGDENMLRTVWQNLLGNAVKYTARNDRAQIEVSVKRADRGEYVFTVKDNGAGFDMQYADKLFGVFQRMHKTSDFPGSGVGLASVRRILGRHGGRIWAEAEAGKGASFHFSLPAQESAST